MISITEFGSTEQLEQFLNDQIKHYLESGAIIPKHLTVFVEVENESSREGFNNVKVFVKNTKYHLQAIQLLDADVNIDFPLFGIAEFIKDFKESFENYISSVYPYFHYGSVYSWRELYDHLEWLFNGDAVSLTTLVKIVNVGEYGLATREVFTGLASNPVSPVGLLIDTVNYSGFVTVRTWMKYIDTVPFEYTGAPVQLVINDKTYWVPGTTLDNENNIALLISPFVEPQE